MSNVPSETVCGEDNSWSSLKMDIPECQPTIQHEYFDAAPYPFAVVLGASTTLLLIATVRAIWMLLAG